MPVPSFLFVAFRFACNELASKPEDIIRDLYGYACGDADFSTRCPVISASSAGNNIGQCGLGIDYAQKNNNFMIDKYFAQSNDLTAFRTFSAFVRFSKTSCCCLNFLMYLTLLSLSFFRTDERSTS